MVKTCYVPMLAVIKDVRTDFGNSVSAGECSETSETAIPVILHLYNSCEMPISNGISLCIHECKSQLCQCILWLQLLNFSKVKTNSNKLCMLCNSLCWLFVWKLSQCNHHAVRNMSPTVCMSPSSSVSTDTCRNASFLVSSLSWCAKFYEQYTGHNTWFRNLHE